MVEQQHSLHSVIEHPFQFKLINITIQLGTNRHSLDISGFYSILNIQFHVIDVILFTVSFQTYPILSSIVKAGGHRALEECRKLFKNEIWNCTLDNKHVIKELPIFVKTTLPYGKLGYQFKLPVKLSYSVERK